VATNRARSGSPALLRLTDPIAARCPVEMSSFSVRIEMSSMPPIRRATGTDSPAMMTLK